MEKLCMKNRILVVLLAVVVIITNSVGIVYGLDTDDLYLIDNYGDIKWILDEDGTLVLTGSGEMPNYSTSDTNRLSPIYYNRTKVKKIVVDAGITSIGDCAFSGCYNAVSISLPDSLITIGNNSFKGCTRCEAISIPEKVEIIGNEAFSYCSSLETLDIPDSVIIVGNEAFAGCDKLTSVDLSEKLTAVCFAAFDHCSNINNVDIPNNANEIGPSAFSYCEKLQTVIIPKKIKTIDVYAFSNCKMLSDIYYEGNEGDWSNVAINTGNECLTNAKIHYLSDKKDFSVDSDVQLSLSTKTVRTGDVIYMGTQEGYRDSWNVINLDKNKKEALLLSTYVQENIKYNSDTTKGADWANSDARAWCQNFYDENLKRNQLVKKTVLSDDDQPVNDYVFFLSSSEAHRYSRFIPAARTSSSGSANRVVWLTRTPIYKNDSGVFFEVPHIRVVNYGTNYLYDADVNIAFPATPAFTLDISGSIPATINGSGGWVIKEPSGGGNWNDPSGGGGSGNDPIPQSPVIWQWEKDNYSFTNSSSYFGQGNSIYIDNKDFASFLSKLDNTEIAQMASWYGSGSDYTPQVKLYNFLTNHLVKWGGSCYGLSLTSALFAVGEKNPTDWGGNNTYGIPALNPNTNTKLESFINIYHISQACNIPIQTERNDYVGDNTFPVFIDGFFNKASAISKTHEPLLIGMYVRTEENGKVKLEKGHALLCYGLENGSWTAQGKECDRRLLIADPNKTEETYLYISKDSTFASYSGDSDYNMFCYNDCSLNNLNVFDYSETAIDMAYNIILSTRNNVVIVGSDPYCKVIIKDGHFTVDSSSTDFFVDTVHKMSDESSADQDCFYRISGKSQKYEIKPLDGEELNASVYFNDYGTDITGKAAAIVLDDKGDLSLKNASGGVSIGLIANDSVFDFAEVSGKADGEVDVKLNNDKIAVSGSISDYTVSNIDENAEKTEITIQGDEDKTVTIGNDDKVRIVDNSGSNAGSGGSGGGGGGGAPATDDIQAVVDLINAIPTPATVKDADAVKAARDAYDKLTPEQKADPKLSDALIKKLKDAEEAVKSGQDQIAASNVSKEIAAIPDDLSKATSDQVSGAVEAYNSLTDGQKKLITADELEKLQAALNYPATKLKVNLKSVKAKKGKKAVVKWKANASANAYQLYYKAKGVKAKKFIIDDPATVTKTIKKLKAGKKYSFKIRTITKVENLSKPGTSINVYGNWSNKKTCKAKK